MQRFILVLILSSLLLVASCSNVEKIDPYDVLQSYVGLWESQKFTNMYDMLTDETKETYETEDFIDRYEKIYHDLQIDNIQINVTEEESEKENDKVTYPIDVSLDSIAGKIEFSSTITAERYINEEEEIDSWLIDWNPGLIFPEIADGGKIRIEKTEPKRGEILDRNEMALAINDIAYEVGVVPEKFTNKDAEIEQLASLLHISTTNITNKVDAEWVQGDHFVPLKTIPISDKETIEELESIPAVSMRDTTGRTYPSADAISHLIGYVGKVTEEELKELKDKNYTENDSIGKRGLEKLFEDKLKGETGVKILIESEDEKGDAVYTTIAESPVKNGENVQVTIDINLQELLYKQYEGKYKGAAAAVDPHTGEILALVSSPSYNPIPLTYGISQAAWDALMNDKRQPFVNRFSATFAPGSVIKPVVGAIGLKNKSITHDEQITIEGLRWKKDNWKDFYVSRVSTSNGPVDLEDALVRSDNIFFAMKAVSMGDDKFVAGLKEFGFDEKLPIDYPFTISQISNSGDLKNEALRANTGYGQGEIEVNVLHMALLYTPFLNEGDLVKPNLLTSDKKGEVWKENLVTKEDAERLKQDLRKVVTHGTAKVIKDEPIELSGKTGTAELKASRDAKGTEDGWFVGYPTKDEDIIIAMLVEDAKDLGASSFAAKKVADTIVKYKDLQN